MKKIFILLIALISMLSSCSNFDDINTNPDTTTKVTSEMLATEALKQSFLSEGDAKAYLSHNTLSKYIAMAKETPSEQYNLVGTYSFSRYTIFPNLENMVSYSLGTIYENSFKGLSSFLQAYNLYYLTMMTGDIPCSEAAQALSGLRKPKYDLQKDVFDDILSLLKTADEYFADARNFNGDFIYEGDVQKWRKATNMFRLKVIMSMSKKITSDKKELFNSIVQDNNLMASNDDNLNVVYTTTIDTWHPLYNQTLFNPYTAVSSLVVDEFKSLEDRRLFYVAEPTVKSIEEGKLETDYDAYTGADPSSTIEKLSVDYSNNEYSIINNRYISEEAGDPLLILSYSEQCFIIAEAVELGWMSGDSKEYYENGVKASLSLFASYDANNTYNHGMSIDDDYINTYTEVNAAYATSKEDRLKQIWMQKYFTKFLQNGYDAYWDFRRTAYPEYPIDPATNLNIDNKDGFPTRWAYPSDEYQTNEDNLKEALERQFTNGYDGTNELMWILTD